MTLKSNSIYQQGIAFTPEEWNELDSSFAKDDANQLQFQVRATGDHRLQVDGIGDNAWQVEGQLDSSFGGKVTLRDGDNIIIAVVVSEKVGMHLNYKLLSVTPRFFGQAPHPLRVEDHKLYEHAIVSQKNYFLNEYNIKDMGDDKVDYVVRVPTPNNIMFGSLELEVYDTESHRRCGSIRESPKNKDSWTVHHANTEINPKIMICLTAIASKSLTKEDADLLGM